MHYKMPSLGYAPSGETLEKFDVEPKVKIEEEVNNVHEHTPITPTDKYIEKIDMD